MISPHAFRSLRHRNYRIYYIGQLVSLSGTWMQAMAQSWLIYRLTGSGVMLGLAGSLTLLPNLLFGLYGGWLADRMPRRRLLLLVQALAMLQALVLAVLTLGGWVQAWHILLLAFTLGLVQAVETPARQSFVVQLVGREDLTNAIALNSSLIHLARFIGPALAGILVAAMGEGPVFLLNALSYLAVIYSLYILQLPDGAKRREAGDGSDGVWAGLHYAWRHALIRTVLAMVATLSLFGGSALVLLPIFVAKVFGHGPQSLGLLMACLGAGSLSGALLLANRRDFALLERRVGVAAIVAGLAVLLFAFTEGYTPAMAVLFVIGLTSTTVFASSNALIQLAVPDHLRGRIMALYTICLHGMVSIGQVVLGVLADTMGAPWTMAISGGLLLIMSLWLTVLLYRANTDTAATM